MTEKIEKIGYGLTRKDGIVYNSFGNVVEYEKLFDGYRRIDWRVYDRSWNEVGSFHPERPECPIEFHQSLKPPYCNTSYINSVIVAQVEGEFDMEDRCVPYHQEPTHEGNILLIREWIGHFTHAENFLFKPFAFTKDWLSLTRWHATSLEKIIKESELEGPFLKNVFPLITPYYLISRNGKVWATEEGISLADKYESHAFFTFTEICGELWFDCDLGDDEPHWQEK